MEKIDNIYQGSGKSHRIIAEALNMLIDRVTTLESLVSVPQKPKGGKKDEKNNLNTGASGDQF